MSNYLYIGNSRDRPPERLPHNSLSFPSRARYYAVKIIVILIFIKVPLIHTQMQYSRIPVVNAMILPDAGP